MKARTEEEANARPLPELRLKNADVSRVTQSAICSKSKAKRVLRQLSAYESFDSIALLATALLGMDVTRATAWARREWTHEARRRGR